MERNDIVASRVKFLRKMNEFHNIITNQDQLFIWMRCGWVNQNHTRGYNWQNLVNTEGLKVPIGNQT